MLRIAVSPKVLRWARERAGFEVADLERKFPKLANWENQTSKPTLRQLENFARVTRAPFGYLFLSDPPVMNLPFPDFRRIENKRVHPISPELLDTIYLMQQRQAWLTEELREDGADPVSFVNSASLASDPEATAQNMRQALGLTNGWAKTNHVRTWMDALRQLRNAIEDAGVMVITNGVVGNNTHRPLKVSEFRGFALSDPYAPLIFVNGVDTKSAQMFTLAHELAHLWLGKAGEGLSGYEELQPSNEPVEQFCDLAAAEFLVPGKELQEAWGKLGRANKSVQDLVKYFKVSPVVIARRLMALEFIQPEEFRAYYHKQTQVEHRFSKTNAGGGNFYNTQDNRVGKLFGSHVISAARAGRIGFKEAYDLTGLNSKTLREYAKRIEMVLP